MQENLLHRERSVKATKNIESVRSYICILFFYQCISFQIVSQKVSENLTERAGQFGLILDDISITHLTFGKEFTQAVELKQVAQQEAEKARFLVEKAEQQKKAAVIAAEGDAQAAVLLAKSFGGAGEGLVELRRIEAAEDIAYQLSKSRNVTYLPQGQNVLLNLPTQN